MSLHKNIEHINIDLGVLPLMYAPGENPFISHEEIYFLLKLAYKKKGNMLEIGVNRGKTTSNLARIAKDENLKFIGVDVTEVPSTICDAQGPGECLSANLVGCDISEENKNHVDIHLINPNNPKSLSELLQNLNLKYDFVFIDGDHSYAGVKRDYESILPFLSENGVMVFHDVWWDVEPPPVKGPLKLLSETEGYIVNKTHLGILRSQMKRFSNV